MYLEEGSFLDSASTPDSGSTITLLAPLPSRQRELGGGGKGEIFDGELGEMDMESVLVVLSSMQLPSIFFFFFFLSDCNKQEKRETERM